MGNEPRRDQAGSILALSAFVLLWRVAAAASPYREGVLATMTEDSLGIRWGLGVMGIVFVACGLYAYAHDRRHMIMIFALSACTGGLHWGGPILSPTPPWRRRSSCSTSSQATTWARLVRQRGWRSPRRRVYPAKPKVGIRATKPNEFWHIESRSSNCSMAPKSTCMS